MIIPFNIEGRRPIWIALSEFYLDTELQDSDFRYIAFAILESPYSFEEVKQINKYEVFPVLQANLLGVAGEWADFDENWLVDKIEILVNKDSKISRTVTEVTYLMFKGMCKNYWKRLETIYNDIRVNPDTFIITCRTLFIEKILPFQFDKRISPIYQKLEKIALEYKQKEQLRSFYAHLQEGQYHINFWAAYFLLEIFELNGTEKLIGLKDDDSIVTFCYDLIERNFQTFKDKEQIKNCSFWLQDKKAAYNKSISANWAGHSKFNS